MPFTLFVIIHTRLVCGYSAKSALFIWKSEILDGEGIPTNTSGSPNIGLMLGRRLRRRPNNKPTLGEPPVFVRMPPAASSIITHLHQQAEN